MTVQDLREHDLTYLDDLDRVDNRQDGERIIAQTLERNSLLVTNRVSVLTAASASAESLYSNGTVRSFPGPMKMNVKEEEKTAKAEAEDEKQEIDPNRLSVLTCASGYTYATSRASVQTYGSSVLTYGSLASRPQSPVEDEAEADGAENRPVHPLPWNPRPSAMSRIVRQRKGPRPLPPLPAKKGEVAPVPSSSTSTGVKRKPRPLPRPPSHVPPLENIAEVPTPAASEESHQQRDGQEQQASTSLSPSALNFSTSARRGSRRRSVRYSALAGTYGYPGRRGSISGPAGAGDASVGVSRASSFRTGGGMSVSGCEVPDVDELVRILDEVDFRKRGSSSRSSRARIGRNVEAWRRGRSDVSSPTSPLSPGELNMGDALEDTRGCVAVPGGGIARNAPGVSSIGLPTPAATPKPRTPPKVIEPLPLPHPVSALLSLPIPPPPSFAAPKPMPGNAASTQSSLLSPPDAHPGSGLCPTPSSSFLYSPTSGVSAPTSHMSFPLPPEELEIPGPESVGAADIPVPAKARDEDGEVTPSTGVRLSFAEKATLPGLALSFAKAIVMGKRDTVSTPPPPPVTVKATAKGSPGKHTSTQDAINDLRNRVSALGRSLPMLALPVPLNPKPTIQMTRQRGASTSEYLPGVPRLMQPVPPVRRRAASSACPLNSDLLPPPVPEKDVVKEKAEEKIGSRHPYAAKPRPAEIDIKAANNYGPSKIPPSAFKIPPTGDGSGSFSAPAVAPLRFRNSRRGSELGVNGTSSSVGLAPPTATPGPGPLTGSSVIGIAPSSGRPSTSDGTTGYTTSSTATFLMSTTPPSSVPSTATITRPATADAMTTSFSVAPVSFTKPQRSASVVYGPSSSTSIPSVAPLRFRSSKSSIGSRTRSATVTGATGDDFNITSVNEDKVEAKLDSTLVPTLLIPEEAEEVCEANVTKASPETETPLSERRARMKQELLDSDALGPELANIIHSIADADPDSQMASLLTIASSINSERQDFNFGGVSPQKGDASADGVDEDELEGSPDPSGKSDRRSTQSSLSADKRRSKGRSVTSVRRRPSATSRRGSRDNLRSQRTFTNSMTTELKNLAPADPAALKALPDPNTFPIPLPTLGSSVPTLVDASAGADGLGDLSSFLKPSPLPKLKVITKFKGDTVLLPSSQAPLSAVSTKSTMSTMSNMSGISAFGHSIGLGSRVKGPRKMNRLTLSDPRSPMTDAAAAAAALVERFKQKRADIASRGPQGGVQRRHQRTGSKDGSGRSRMPLTGSGFFGYVISGKQKLFVGRVTDILLFSSVPDPASVPSQTQFFAVPAQPFAGRVRTGQAPRSSVRATCFLNRIHERSRTSFLLPR